ncbi:glutathione S-transferase C-terminal domain-containing protein, partial [Planktotalea sp.]|uniref:glutathione S-transferase family protein n=1 Tax=Planktotalea sp. TaxID=2029877 RepID=UPI0025E876D9
TNQSLRYSIRSDVQLYMTTDNMFAELDNRLAKHEWILGDKMTMADIALIPQYALFRWNDFPFEAYPNFLAYVAQWQKRPTYVKAIGDYMPSSMSLPESFTCVA